MYYSKIVLSDNGYKLIKYPRGFSISEPKTLANSLLQFLPLAVLFILLAINLLSNGDKTIACIYAFPFVLWMCFFMFYPATIHFNSRNKKALLFNAMKTVPFEEIQFLKTDQLKLILIHMHEVHVIFKASNLDNLNKWEMFLNQILQGIDPKESETQNSK